MPPSGTYTIDGLGSGHGHGLSQWGAYGAAKVDDLSANQILSFYYPHTTLATKSVTQTIRVLLTAVNAPANGFVEFAPATGLEVTPTGGQATTLPTAADSGDAIDLWRISKTAATLALQAHWANAWHVQTADLGASATVDDPAAMITMVVPARGSAHPIRYRGSVTAQLQSGAVQAVNVLPVESYIDAVVPSEMPSSWAPAALQAQAVAARTYAWHAITSPKASWFDIDGDTRDQGYPGAAVETTNTNDAVHATAGEVAVDSTGDPILAQYGAADGGWTVSGGQRYLPARRDPYDGLVPNTSHAWTATVTVAAIEAAYSSIGTLQQLVITGRDGHGSWGGRITTMSLVGSDATVDISGSQFQASFGLRSPWFRPTPPPAAPSALAAAVKVHTVTLTWKAPKSVSGAAAVTGYRARLTPGRRKTRVDPNTTTATFSNLAPGSYTARVVATSAAGAGPPASVPVTVKLL